MNPTKYLKGLEDKNRELSMKNSELAELYQTLAEAERSYQVSYVQKITQLRMDGVAVTLAKELAKGDSVIADLFFKVKIAEGVLVACREKIKDIRSAIESYRSILSWLKAELESK